MFRFYAILIFSLMCLFALEAADSCSDLKTRIHQLESQTLKPSSSDKNLSLLLKQLAHAYYQDQNQEKAFAAFLKAIDLAETEVYPFSSADVQIYTEALQIYLDPHAQSTRETANKILAKYGELVDKQPELLQTTFLVAASYANRGCFDKFFDLYYFAYRHCPEHYLSFKTKAIIHMKLLERSSSSQFKEEEREKILVALDEAIKRYPQDHTLYKMAIAFVSTSKKKPLIEVSLQKIINDNIVIPRTDIGFYVEEAVKTKQYELAQALLNKAGGWYPYSRIINTAQEYLNSRKRG